MHLGLLTLAKYLVVTTLFHYALRYWLDLVFGITMMSYRSSLAFVPTE
jgi:hypothetical protein